MSKLACLVLITAACCSPADGAVVGKAVAKGVKGVDAAAIRPVIQDLLDNDRPGSTRPWKSAASGGNVKLISGGEKSGEACGKVRTTVLTQGRESAGYVFRYCRDAKGSWRTAG